MYAIGCLVTTVLTFFGATPISTQSDDSTIVGALRPQTDEIKCGPPHYCARTDRKKEPYPDQAPILRAAGSVVKDPVFGSRILRVTDSRTRSGFTGWSFHTAGSSEQNTWNANARRFYVEGDGGRFFVFDFDSDNFLLRSTGLDLSDTMQTEAEFSYINPDVIYGWGPEGPPRFLAYNFATKKVSILHDPNECVRVDRNWHGLDISASGDDQRLMGVFGPQQDNDPFVYIYDRNLGCRWYNTSTGEIGGRWGPKGQSPVGKKFLVHNARLSKSGQYVAIAPSDMELVIWNVDTLEAKVCAHNDPDSCGGHRALGYSHMINPAGKKDSMNLLIRPFDNLLSFSQLIPDLPKQADWYEAKHLSWNNANPSDTAPVCLSTYRDDNPVGAGLPLRVDRAWDSEILCVGVEEKNTVWRFAHDYTTARNGFFSTPRGNVSQDGRFYIFSSDWEDTLGAGQNGGYRTDAFIVELK